VHGSLLACTGRSGHVRGSQRVRGCYGSSCGKAGSKLAGPLLPAPAPRSLLLLPAPVSEAKPPKAKAVLPIPCRLKHSLYCKVIPDDHIQLFNSNSHHVEQELGKRIRPSEMDKLTCLICCGPPRGGAGAR
jgi:hypothetical protein